jgi:CBS domain-containing protein
MKARSLMSAPVHCLAADTPTGAAAEFLVEHGFTAAPVIDDDGHLIGILTEADLLPGSIAAEHNRGGFRAVQRAVPSPVAGVMTSPVQSMTPGADIADVADAMLQGRIRCLPIVDGDAVVGVITRRDLLRAAYRR